MAGSVPGAVVVVDPSGPAGAVVVVVGGAVVDVDDGATWARAEGAATVSSATTGTRIQRSRNMALFVHRREAFEV
jgi:hypothetical protein